MILNGNGLYLLSIIIYLMHFVVSQLYSFCMNLTITIYRQYFSSINVPDWLFGIKSIAFYGTEYHLYGSEKKT